MTILEQTLKSVNQARVAMNLAPLKKMPKGEPGCPKDCPIAKGLGYGFDVKYIHVSSSDVDKIAAIAKAWNSEFHDFTAIDSEPYAWVTMPVHMQRFITNFDKRDPKYKSLVLKVKKNDTK